MQTTLENSGWVKASRLPGIFRYHNASTGRKALWALGVLLGIQLVSLIMPAMVSGATFISTGVSANLPLTMLCGLVLAHIMADKGTRFLLRFGTPRTSVWLGNLLSLIKWTLVLLVGTALVSVLQCALVLLLSGMLPDKFTLISYYMPALTTQQVFSQTLTDTLTALPLQALWVVEWSCLFYLLACCMRRQKGWTIAVIVGVPLALFIALLIPAVQQTVAAVQNANDGEVVMMGLQWYQWLLSAAEWMETQWPWIQLLSAIASLPLSWLCMRGTPQP